ncbi:tyrosine-type recombinase/integrase [Klebsiella quasipneumoniae]
MEQMYKYHVKPDFGNSYVDKIKPPKIQKWINHLSTTLVQYRSVLTYLII